MSDDLDIRSGGVVAVDTASLRQVAEEFATLAAGLSDVQADVNDIFTRLLWADPMIAEVAWQAAGVLRRTEEAAHAATAMTAKLGDAATVYEIVELRAERALAFAAGDGTAVAALDTRIAAAVGGDPYLLLKAVSLETLWWLAGPNELARQAGESPLGAFGASAASLFGIAIGLYGRGRVSGDARLSGPAPAVETRQVGAVVPAAPPNGLVALMNRIPQEPAQVRVERYTMPDGTRRFAVYIAGTRSPLDPREPWNSESNLALYSGQRSASSEATMQALRHAGAQPGDAVYAVGHSQGGMIASHLAFDGQYDVRALVTLGSPVSAEVGSGTLSVQLRHTDDPVAVLADGGHPDRVGSEDSFIAERVADPEAGIQDIGLAAHHLDAYRETAAMVDESSDPRAAALDDVLGELAEAQAVDVLEYAAVRSASTPPTGYVIPPRPGYDPYAVP